MFRIGTTINMTDMIYGRLLVIERSERRKTDQEAAYWWCECSCGYPKRVRIRGDALRNGNSKSCGCIPRELLKTKRGGSIKGKPHKYPATRSNTPRKGN
jgi:hypothetical protein